MLLVMLMGIARCASTDFCPNDNAIIAAVQSMNESESWALSQTPEYEQALIGTPLIKGISDVICGEPVPAKIPTISCRFTIHYATHDSYRVARLILEGQWKIEQTMAVARRR